MAKLLLAQNSKKELEGLMTISAFVKGKHQVELVTGSQSDIKDKVISFKPDVFGMYVLTMDHNWSLKTAKTVKSANPETITLLGGPHPTFYTDIISENYVDGICVGEGEKATLNLLNRIDANIDWTDTPSLWIKKNGKIFKNGLDSLLTPEEIPMPDRQLYNNFPEISQSSKIQIMCSRGCPFDCSFCINHGYREMYGSEFFRTKKIESVISDLEETKKRRTLETVIIHDDIFGANKRWLNDFLKEYKSKIDLPFYCLLRCEYVTEELIDKIIDARCYEVGIGLESGDERIRNKVLNKKLSNDSLRKAVSILKNKDISFHTFNMFCLPDENLKSAFKTLDLNLEIHPDVIYTQIFHPYPGTAFYSKEVEPYIISDSFNKFSTNYKYHPDFNKIQRLQKLSMLTIKFPFIRKFLPALVRLPLDRLYDKISQLSWEKLYYPKITNRARKNSSLFN